MGSQFEGKTGSRNVIQCVCRHGEREGELGRVRVQVWGREERTELGHGGIARRWVDMRRADEVIHVSQGREQLTFGKEAWEAKARRNSPHSTANHAGPGSHCLNR